MGSIIGKDARMKSLIGKKAPAVRLKDQDEKARSLSEFKGQYVVLYFYPKDGTPGCTVEAKSFRDSMNDLVDAGVAVVGVSADSCGSHKKFAEKHELNFPLLADEKKEVVKKYGVWKPKKMFGKTFFGVKRQSFLIGPDGKVLKHYEKVVPKDHPTKVLKDVRELST